MSEVVPRRRKGMTPQKSAALLILICFLIGLVIAVHGLILISSPADKSDTMLRTVLIKKGANYGEITDELLGKGIIIDPRGFKIAGKIVGAERKIKAGEYELSPSMSPAKIVNEMLEGNVKRYTVTFPEGLDVRAMAVKIDEAELGAGEEFVSFALSEKSASELALPGPTLEGYLFPDTYDFSKPVTGRDIAVRMAERFKEVYDEEVGEAAANSTLGLKEIATLASIIEKETGARGEMAAISAVFHNRLKRGIALQSDPTVIYGIWYSTGTFDGNLTRSHLTTSTPYNTYTRPGLPPGPIANPGRGALKAAVNPADVDYLYFVSKNDGTHYFSKTLTEHNLAVEKFQKRRR